MEIVVLSDTHLRPDRPRELPTAVWRAVERADAVVHAGDVITGELLERLSEHAPVHAVLGNNDVSELADRLPSELIVELGGVRVAVTHIGGPAATRARRLARRFPDAAVVVFGHDHVPSVEQVPGGPLLFDPGSPTTRRSVPELAFGVLRLEDGRVIEHRHEFL